MRFSIPATWAMIKRIGVAIDEKNVGLISAGVAFYGLLAIFPGISALIAIFGLVADPQVVFEQLALLQEFIPPDAYSLIEVQMKGLLGARAETLGLATVISISVALWSARAGVAALMRGLNAIFSAPSRGGLRHILVALTLTISLIGIAITAMFTVLITPVLLKLLPLPSDLSLLLDMLRWAVSLFVLLAALGLLYRYGPNKRGARMKWVTPGSFIVVIVWLAASAGFSFYVTNFGSYNEVYGSIGAVIALLMWMYITSYLILMGAVINVDMARDRNTPKVTGTTDIAQESP